MKLSKRGEYGLKALIDLASQDDPQTLVQIKDIAQRQQIPVKFLEQIMLTMKNGGILHSRAGIGGGYYLARPAAEITLGQVVRLLDGPLAPILVRQPDGLRALCVRRRGDLRLAAGDAGCAQRHRRHSGQDHAGRCLDPGGTRPARRQAPGAPRCQKHNRRNRQALDRTRRAARFFCR